MDTNSAKGICIVIILSLAIIFGWIPVYLYHRGILSATGSNKRKLILDFFNCFAGGVFLSTCLLSILTEGREDFETYKEKVGFTNNFPFYEAIAGMGLFLVAMVDKIGFAIMSGQNKHGQGECSPKHVSRKLSHSSGQQHHQPRHHGKYQATAVVERNDDSRAKASVEVASKTGIQQMSTGNVNNDGLTSTTMATFDEHREAVVNIVNRSPGSGDAMGKAKEDVASGGHNCHQQASNSSGSGQFDSNVKAENIEETGMGSVANMSVMRAVMLMVALSFHSVFDGLAVGLQTSASEIWQLIIAVSFHKSLVAFCLGLELAAASAGKLLRPVGLVALFSIMTPIGIGIGMGVTSSSVDELAQLLVSSILQGLATGVFMYVTFFEILGHQFSHAHHDGFNLWVEFGKIGVAVLGFVCMGGVRLLDKD